MGTNLPPLLPIPSDAVDVNFPPPQYEADFAATVGNAVTDSDGWDALLQPLSDFVGSLPSFLSGLDLSLSAMSAAFGGVDQVWEQDFSSALSSAISSGQSAFDKVDVALTSNTPPAPGTPPAGASGGASGSSGCEQDIYFPSFTVSNPTSRATITFKNTRNASMKIEEVDIISRSPDVWSFVSHLPAVLPAGASGTIDVVAVIKPDLVNRALLQITTDDPNSPHKICLFLPIDSSGPPGGACGSVGKGVPLPECPPEL
jgi:hypothetical protein